MTSKFHQFDHRFRDWREQEKLPAVDRQMIYSFGTFLPRIADLPHCIMWNEVREQEGVLQVVACKAGIWGNAEPWFEANGEPLIPPEDGNFSELFALWELPQNQEQVTDHVHKEAVPFTMLIDAQTPKNVLCKLYQCEVDYSDYYFYIDRLSEWIEDLRWAYVPLEWDGKFGLFVAPNDLQTLVDEVRDTLQRTGCIAFSLAQRGERWHWDGPVQC